MARICIHEIRYNAENHSIEYNASLRMPGRSITISARTDMVSTDIGLASLRQLACKHAAALLTKPSAAGDRLDSPH